MSEAESEMSEVTTTINPDEMLALPVGAVVREYMTTEVASGAVDWKKEDGELWRCVAVSGVIAPFFDVVSTFKPTPTSEFGADYGLGINSVFELVTSTSSEEEAA